MRTERFGRLPVWIRAVSGLIATALILARYLPTTVFSPLDWPDGGWTWGINVAVEKGMAFGRELVFTYGPFGAIVSNAYHPAVHNLLVGGGVVFGLAFAAGLTACPMRAAMLAAALAIPLVQWNDSLLFALPVPALFAMAAHLPSDAIPWRLRLAIGLLVPVLALMPLTKLSLLPVSFLGLSGIGVFLWQNASRKWLVALPAAFLVFLAGFWGAAGQKLTVLPLYFQNGLRIVGGYNDAMAVRGPKATVLLAFCAIFMFLILAGMQARLYRRSRAVPLVLVLAILAFLIFKAGFVRQDSGHESDYFATIALLFLSSSAAMSPARAVFALAAGLLCAGRSINPDHPLLVVVLASEHGSANNLRNAWRLVADPGYLDRDFARAASGIPHLPWSPPGTADLYGDRLARLFSTGLSWSPRPVIESYSAYTPYLAVMNADHLSSPLAPDNIFFQVSAIDDRLPSMEDGLSWPLLMSLYDPVAYDWLTDMLLLRRSEHAQTTQIGQPILQAQAALGETIVVPPSQHALWATIDLQRTVAGDFYAALWKPPPVSIHLQLDDGSHHEFRFIPGIGRSGFVISPLVESSLDFLALRSTPGQPARELHHALSIRLESVKAHWAWKGRYNITLAPIVFSVSYQPVEMPVETAPVAAEIPSPHPDARCFLDQVNGNPVSSHPTNSGAIVTLAGWALWNASPAVASGTIDIGLSDGSHAYRLHARAVARGDVAATYKLPSSIPLGFQALGALTGLHPGNYALYAVTRHGSEARSCQLNGSLLIGNDGVAAGH